MSNTEQAAAAATPAARIAEEDIAFHDTICYSEGRAPIPEIHEIVSLPRP
ncbi:MULTISPECIES: hypothetical protein [Mycolicibacterium]|uniref:GntR family transcriptional regulator n=1 Tax=Mycolicibacterium pallens TaxID=370524 RepID=A0ABX8VVX3_9MYCO|nr:hypothetical protein [Mycolicibacterium pallens]QYL20210.1 hypothetical protein K0O64_23445 [Mycolicibacterium pallens]